MNTSQGIVKVITTRPAGKGMAYNFCLEDGTWYGFGFNEPNFAKGDYIKFAWTANGAFKNVEQNSVEILDNPTGTPPQQAAPAAAAGSSKTNWDEKDKRITMLACRKDAIELAKVAIEQGALKLGTKNKQQALAEAIDQIAGDLYYGIYGEDFPLNNRPVEAEEVSNDSEE